MQLTKFGHSCVRFDDGARSLAIDPGVFSNVDAALDGAQAVLITHEHADHLDATKIEAALGRDPRLRVWAPAGVAASLARFGDQVVVAAPGQQFEAAGFAVHTFGGQHALIHPAIPIVANVAYLVEGRAYHPGDSLIVPPVPVEVLLLPSVAPWSKVSEVIDYAIAVRAPRAYPIHDGFVTDFYNAVLARNFEPFVGQFGFEYAAWDGDVSV